MKTKIILVSFLILTITSLFYFTSASEYNPNEISKEFISINHNINNEMNNENEFREIELKLESEKLQYLIYGQSTEYQCENVITDDNNTLNGFNISKNDGEIYKDLIDYEYGNGVKVKYCKRDNNTETGKNASVIVKGIKNKDEFINYNTSNIFSNDSVFDWNIIPRIRIDTSYANNYENYHSKVCDVIVTNTKGESIIYTLKVMNFKQDCLTKYTGEYLEKFSSQMESPADFKIPAGHFFNPDKNNLDLTKLDISIYWYDNCDMWIDYVKIQNEPAYNILTLNCATYTQYVLDEIDNLKELENIYSLKVNYYITELATNQYPTFLYVNSLLEKYSENKYKISLKKNEELYKNLITANKLEL